MLWPVCRQAGKVGVELNGRPVEPNLQTSWRNAQVQAVDGEVAMNKQDERELLAACLAWACRNQPDMKNLAKLLTLAVANSTSTASPEWKSMWAYACELAEEFRDEHDEKHFMPTPINGRG
jgi:hypothetical protein